MQVFRRSTRSQKSLIISLLQRILLSHERVSEGDAEIATAYVARFIRRILAAIGTESKAASPRPGAVEAALNNQQIAGNNEADIFAELVNDYEEDHEGR